MYLVAYVVAAICYVMGNVVLLRVLRFEKALGHTWWSMLTPRKAWQTPEQRPRVLLLSFFFGLATLMILTGHNLQP